MNFIEHLVKYELLQGAARLFERARDTSQSLPPEVRKTYGECGHVFRNIPKNYDDESIEQAALKIQSLVESVSNDLDSDIKDEMLNTYMYAVNILGASLSL